ncbi:MAG: acetolactate synthase isozyme1 large subunit [Silicimonas sp.]|nr:acetolactate synthase isozyme1 large subunit [Silicimonas sp.]
MLADRGVDTVFGIPGVHNIELYRGIEAAGLRHILARHEQGAGFMADGYARATGRPGVCFVISGPGLTNIMTPMGQAHSDSVPMLVISTCLDESAAKRGQLHQMKDQEGAGRTVADWSETARTPEAAFDLVERALAEFISVRPRPKAIHVPIETLGNPAPIFPAGGMAEGPLGTAWDGHISALAHALRNAKRPLFLFGGGARWIDAAGPVLKRWNAASMTTYAGRGVVPPGAPLHFGSYLARPSSVEALNRADTIFVFGSELAQGDLWRDVLGTDTRLIRVDIDAEVLARPGQYPVYGEAFGVFEDLSRAVEEGLETDWTPAEVAAWRAKWKAEIDAERPGIVPVCDALSAALPANTMVFSDMTQFAYAAKEVWDMPQPGLWHHPTGFGTLGYALPAAIGGCLGHDGPVLAIAGDYGFQYTIQELGTAAELGLSLPILLWDNNALGEIRDNMIAAQIAPVAVTLRNPEWEALARAYGCGYTAPASVQELTDSINAAFTAGRPTIIRATPEIGT